MKPETFVDYYELLQLSPNADHAAIHVMHYHLTEKYHPGNKETGDLQRHREVLQAYKVLGSQESRAQYDFEYHRHGNSGASSSRKQSPSGAPDVEGGFELERAKRQSILYLLYQKRLKEMSKPNLTMRDFESMLACPKETLEFTIWYLKELDCLRPGDNGAYSITVKGVELYERNAEDMQDIVVLPSPGKLKAIAPAR